MNRKISSFIIFLNAIFFSFSSQEGSDSLFFSELEKKILQEYQLCNGDSLPSRKALLKWKSEINFLIESQDYPALVKKYADETGIDPLNARPCEILNWSNQQLRRKNEDAAFLEQSKKDILKRRADSLYALQELMRNPEKPYQFEKIPFGITKKGFLILAGSYRNLSDEGNLVIVDSILIGSLVLTGAFHFDRNGLLNQYELESASAPLDSLDPWVRPQADSMAAFMQRKIGSAADHSFRVGRFDITKGRLAILKLWNLPEASVYAGLATSNYRYYAKLIVRSKVTSNEMQKDSVH